MLVKDIVWLTTHDSNVDFLNKIFEEKQIDIDVRLTSLGEMSLTAHECIASGAKVLIMRGGLATELKKTLPVAVVDMKHTYIDFYEIMQQVYQTTKQFALIGWYKNVKGFERFQESLGDSMYYVELEGMDAVNIVVQIELVLQEIKEQGITVVVGGGAVVKQALKLGMHGVYIGLDKYSAIEAAEEAVNLLRIVKEQNLRYETISSIFNCVSDGIVAIDKDGFITNINTLAQSILNIPRDNWQKLKLEEILREPKLQRTLDYGVEMTNQIVAFGDSRLVISALPIKVVGVTVGAVATIQKVDKIQKLEKKIRAASIEKGMYAKKNFDDIIGSSAVMHQLKEKARRYAKTDSTVLITGESGVGKELFAQSIHNESRRRDAPFLAINCAALPENLLESELFGYVKGAFTGARNEGKAGVFELAHMGTIFLDEISEISLDVQARLLRVLQEKEITRIGDDKVISVDVRILAASNKNLLYEVERGVFRNDLYYRLCVLPLHLNPLNERSEDVLEIIQSLMYATIGEAAEFSEGAKRLLVSYQWPGNVRELSNFVERLTVLNISPVFNEQQVLEALNLDACHDGKQAKFAARTDYCPGRDATLEEIIALLEKNGGRKNITAQQLGISTTTLWRRLHKTV